MMEGLVQISLELNDWTLWRSLEYNGRTYRLPWNEWLIFLCYYWVIFGILCKSTTLVCERVLETTYISLNLHLWNCFEKFANTHKIYYEVILIPFYTIFFQEIATLIRLDLCRAWGYALCFNWDDFDNEKLFGFDGCFALKFWGLDLFWNLDKFEEVIFKIWISPFIIRMGQHPRLFRVSMQTGCYKWY
jgi:hypothetical protein